MGVPALIIWPWVAIHAATPPPPPTDDLHSWRSEFHPQVGTIPCHTEFATPSSNMLQRLVVRDDQFPSGLGRLEQIPSRRGLVPQPIFGGGEVGEEGHWNLFHLRHYQHLQGTPQAIRTCGDIIEPLRARS